MPLAGRPVLAGKELSFSFMSMSPPHSGALMALIHGETGPDDSPDGWDEAPELAPVLVHRRGVDELLELMADVSACPGLVDRAANERGYRPEPRRQAA
jgi:hypothetical protein